MLDSFVPFLFTFAAMEQKPPPRLVPVVGKVVVDGKVILFRPTRRKPVLKVVKG